MTYMDKKMSAAKVSPMRPDTSTSYLRKVRLFVINSIVDIYILIFNKLL